MYVNYKSDWDFDADCFNYFIIILKYMSFLYFGNVAASVPPVFDTSPCMKEMLNYEDCVYE